MEHRPDQILSVVMPCYNEAGTIRLVVKRVLDSPWTGELVVVDDGSTDGTRETLAELDDPRVRVLLHDRNRGKGAALRTGFAAVSYGDVVIVQDADLEYDPAEYPDAARRRSCAGHAEVVYGSRYLVR